MKIILIISVLLFALSNTIAQNDLQVYLETFKDSFGIIKNDVCVKQGDMPEVKLFRQPLELEYFEVLLLSDTSFCFLLQTFPVCSYSKYIQNSSGAWDLITATHIWTHDTRHFKIDPYEPYVCSLLGEDKILVKKDDGTEQIVTAQPFGEGLKAKKD